MLTHLGWEGAKMTVIESVFWCGEVILNFISNRNSWNMNIFYLASITFFYKFNKSSLKFYQQKRNHFNPVNSSWQPKSRWTTFFCLCLGCWHYSSGGLGDLHIKISERAPSNRFLSRNRLLNLFSFSYIFVQKKKRKRIFILGIATETTSQMMIALNCFLPRTHFFLLVRVCVFRVQLVWN